MSDINKHLELESLGVLRQVTVPVELAWMTADEKSFVLEMLWAGETGVHKSTVAKREKAAPTLEFNLTVRGLAEWLTDKAGRPVSLALTWKGAEVAELLSLVAKNENRKAARLAAG